ncbi:MAG TPA: FkbM family methyltransferase [Xanthobacteraceae bacterium]
MAGEVLIDRPPVRVRSCKHGAMIYFSTDHYIGRSLDLYGEYSEGEIDLFRQIVRPGMVALDVGANIGVFTVYLAGSVGPSGKVYAFEPQRTLYHVLCGNLALNGLANVTAVHGALGAQPGSILVPALDYAKGGNFGGLALTQKREGAFRGENVGVSTLDALALGQCNFIKIDVEGMEREVLSGAAETLARCRPLLYVENDRGESSAALISWLLAHDYRLFWHMPRLFNPGNHFGEKHDAFPGVVSINMLGVPRGTSMRVELHEIVSPQDDWRSADRIGIELAVCAAALAKTPDDVAALNRMGLALHQQSRLDEALVLYDKALGVNSQVAEVLYNRGNTLLALKRPADAVADYEKALALKPDFVVALNNRGYALQLLGRHQEALASYEAALALKPDHVTAATNRRLLLEQIGRGQAGEEQRSE